MDDSIDYEEDFVEEVETKPVESAKQPQKVEDDEEDYAEDDDFEEVKEDAVAPKPEEVKKQP